MKNEKDTVLVFEELMNASSTSEALKIIDHDTNDAARYTFSQFFAFYLANHPDLKISTIINNSGLSRQYAHAVMDGTKNASRDKIIALCFASSMSLDDTNHALEYAGHNKLYSKNKRDAFLIYHINIKALGKSSFKDVHDLNDFLYEQGQDLLG